MQLTCIAPHKAGIRVNARDLRCRALKMLR